MTNPVTLESSFVTQVIAHSAKNGKSIHAGSSFKDLRAATKTGLQDSVT